MPKTDAEKKEYKRLWYLKNKDKYKCEHSRQKNTCIECGGSGICEHSRQKSTCIECGGSGVCEHNKSKYICVECGGNGICEHNKRKDGCVECGGNGICEHNKRKYRCVECGGNGICEHNKRKDGCIECGGSGVCEHKRQKRECKDCNFTHYLVHLQRNQIYRLVKLSNHKKLQHSIEYLGCNIEYFKEFMEKKMTALMTWDNIHLDHIKPVSSFNLNDQDEFLNCCNYTNFQPLLAVDNLNKSDKWKEEDNIFWTANIINKEYLDLYIPK